MLRWRLSLGPVLIAALCGVFAWDARLGPAAPVLLVLAMLLAVRSAWEMTQLARVRGLHPSFYRVAAYSAAIVGSAWLPRWTACCPRSLPPWTSLEWVLLTLTGSWMLLLATYAIRYESPGDTLENIGVELVAVCYVAVFLAVTLQLRWVDDARWGYLPLGSLVVATKSGDTLAFTFGKILGGKKLIPRLSPGKTWSGAVGAIVGAGLGAGLWFQYAPGWLTDGGQPGPVWSGWLFGVLVGLAGMMGDLCESLIKRDVGQKDSAPLLPGFGGLLDLLDSVLYAGPLAYLLWLCLPLVQRTAAG